MGILRRVASGLATHGMGGRIGQPLAVLDVGDVGRPPGA
jgi:hypothetical protein